VPPTEYATDVFADVWDGHLVVALNFNEAISVLGESGKRFAVYESERDSLSEWSLLGTYWGEIRASAACGDELWVFLPESVLRTYRLGSPADIREHKAGSSVARLPFDWEALTACSDEGGLWTVGVALNDDGKHHIVVARYGLTPEHGWQLNFPVGPPVPSLRSPGGGPPGGVSTDPEGGGLLVPRVRAHVSQDSIYVYWSLLRPGLGIAPKVYGAQLVRSAKEGVYWRELPALVFDHEDFCAAPGTGGRPGIVLREPPPTVTGKPERHLNRAELDESGKSWHLPYEVTLSSEKVLFGLMPGCSWVKWDKGELLVRSDTQRVELLKHDSGAWEIVEPPGVSWLMLHLAEVQVMVLLAGSAFLIVAGSAAFAIRFVRLRRTGSARPYGVGMSNSPPAPIGARALAALFDVLLVGIPVLTLVGLPAPAANPLIPGWRPLLPYGLVIVALVCYGAFMEAWLGATLGKLSVGLRVASLDGEHPGMLRALVRNVLRPIDFFPFLPIPTGAVGLSFMILTASRSRLGDLAAGTVVISLPPSFRDPLAV
jgi:uncharacterized RDD family membrane protein YckC